MVAKRRHGGLLRRSKTGRFLPLSLLLLPLCLALIGCRYDRTTLDEVQANPLGTAIRQEVELLRQGNIADLIKQFLSTRQLDRMQTKLLQLAAAFPHEEPEKVELVGYKCTPQPGVSVSSAGKIRSDKCDFQLSFQYIFPSGPILATVNFHLHEERIALDDMSVAQLRVPLELTPIGSLEHTSTIGVVAILLATLSIGLTIWTLIWTWRGPRPTWPWAWRIAMLAGLGLWSVDCQEGVWSWQTICLGIPIVNFEVGPYQPLSLGIYVPVFALAYWARHGVRQGRARDLAWLRDQEIADKFS